MSPAGWQNIRGWLSPDEGYALWLSAMGGRVLEIGSYAGRSTVCMARGAKHITSIDSHKGDRDVGPADTETEFRENLERYGVADMVDVLVGDIKDAEIWIDDASYDLLFIDAEHSLDCVNRCLRLFLPKVRPGGVLAMHDWDYSEVREAAERHGLTSPRMVIGSLAIFDLSQ